MCHCTHLAFAFAKAHGLDVDSPTQLYGWFANRLQEYISAKPRTMPPPSSLPSGSVATVHFVRRSCTPPMRPFPSLLPSSLSLSTSTPPRSSTLASAIQVLQSSHPQIAFGSAISAPSDHPPALSLSPLQPLLCIVSPSSCRDLNHTPRHHTRLNTSRLSSFGPLLTSRFPFICLSFVLFLSLSLSSHLYLLPC
ncbi:hypothetical protein F5148DRAFT_1272410 [Russula earlei]|uniref:Uncharacterized protein n=1 Tax=Russula earlei TaxID=71964 RepID=A0ACC0TS75_9AGAM|nr:hypothetical protein F5148DRAFT_1272410 [Russula earlei]